MTSEEYIELKNELEELKSCVEAQSQTLQKIHTALVGDKSFGQLGIVQMVRKHDDWIENQKYMWAKIYGGIAVGSAVISATLKYFL